VNDWAVRASGPPLSFQYRDGLCPVGSPCFRQFPIRWEALETITWSNVAVVIEKSSNFAQWTHGTAQGKE